MMKRYSMPRRQPADAGFTLPELLVGIALAAMISILLVQTLRSARQGLAFSERAGEIGNTLAAQTYLRHALLQAQPVTAANGAGSGLSFDGNAQSVSFLTSFVPRGAYSGLYRVELAIEPSPKLPSQSDLVVRQRLFRPGVAGGDVTLPVTSRLVENIAGADFEYFVKSADDGEADWLPSWQHPSQLPSLVGVTVRFPAGDQRTWPRLNVPLYASAASTTACPPRVACQ
jgi:prepilin-type N-terminal cleavage/methylation domain-containing protein